MSRPVDGTDGPRFLVFVSEAMGAGALARASDLAAARGDTALVVRGLLPGETIGDLARRWREGVGEAPLAIDPRPFREHAVEAVPAVLDRETGRLVHGTANPAVALDAEDGETLGTVVAVAEVDFAEAVRTRLAGIDWDEKRRAALDRFWQRAPLVGLRPAREDAVRRIDPRIRLARDFVLPDGTVLARAGEVIDPLAEHPFTLTLIAFDARRPGEVAIAEAEAARAARPVPMVTGLDRARGWQRMAELRERFGRPVYLLTPEVRARFRLERSVSVVTARGGRFHVRELAARVSTDTAEAVR